MKRFMIFTLALLASTLVCAEEDCYQSVMPASEMVNSNFPKLIKTTRAVAKSLNKNQEVFVLNIINKCNDPISLAIAFEGKPGIDMNGMASLFATKTMSKGWWTVEPGGRREIVIDHMLDEFYYLHARTDKVYWGKNKNFKVMTPSGEKSLAFTQYDSLSNCVFKSAKGMYYCTNEYSCN